jgi:DhnA family fructose-bisphosphate aldolase class Ia
MVGPKTHRLKHIFRDDGKAVIFAMDHAGMFGMQEGLEKPGKVISKVRAGGADAILTTYGISARFADEIGDMGLIVRVDGGNSNLAKERGPMSLIYDVPAALRLGADAVGAMGWPGSRFEGQMLPYLSELIRQGTEWNVPVMAEMLPAGFENPKEWWTPENIGHACRIGAELGVDFIKTNYTGDPESFRRICEQVYVPIVILGGSQSKDPRDLLKGIHEAMQAGASGVAVGRNIYQSGHPEKVTAAIVAIVHETATVDEAMKRLA